MQSTTGWAAAPKRDRSKSRRSGKLLVLLVVILFLLSAALVLWWVARLYAEDGSRIVSAGQLSASEARTVLDDEAKRNRITVSMAPVLQWDESNESLMVNFIVAPGNNGYSERFEIEQDGKVVYASETVEPDHAIEHVRAVGVHEGSAIVTVYAVDSSGKDRGSPVSVESQVVETGR